MKAFLITLSFIVMITLTVIVWACVKIGAEADKEIEKYFSSNSDEKEKKG